MKQIALRSGLAGFLAAVCCLGMFSTSTAAQKQTPPKTAVANPSVREQMPTIKTAPGVPKKPESPDVLAEVNGEKIYKKNITDEAYRQHAREILDTKIKFMLIDTACQQNNISVTRAEEDAEIQKMAQAFGLESKDWLDTILEERGMSPEIYRSDLIRPLLQIRKLAGPRLQVSEAEVNKEFEANYGPSVQVRQIVHNSRPAIEKIRESVVANPESFDTEAKKSSIDKVSAAHGGMIRPIRRSQSPETEMIEKVVFSLREKEISNIIDLPNGNFMILKCEQKFDRVNVDLKAVRETLIVKIRDRKARAVSDEVFSELQANAKIVNIVNDPNLSKQYPKTAAVVNGVEITNADVAEACMKRYGEIVLNEYISILILAQECKKRNIAISDADLDQEIAERAAMEVQLKSDGTPNVELWLETQAKYQNVPIATIRYNTVRPLVMLKKLSIAGVQVTEEDIIKGFEASHGPRVRALAIFTDNMRRAHQLWDEANKVKIKEHFGDLAAKYSIHAPSKALRGEIKPIQKYGGMPTLEEHAFKLQPGEISEIIQLAPEEFVILYCLGQTIPVVTNIDDVRDMIQQDIFQKKLQLEMQKYLENLYTRCTITNYLTGETRLARQPDQQPVRR